MVILSSTNRTMHERKIGMAWVEFVLFVNLFVNVVCNKDTLCLDEVKDCIFDGEQIFFCIDSFQKEHYALHPSIYRD